jgi:hypothetical protein
LASLQISTHLSYIFYVSNPVGLDSSCKTRGAEYTPCPGANLTLKVKIMSLDDMVPVDKNKDDMKGRILRVNAKSAFG